MPSLWIDESVRDGEFLVVGGFYCDNSSISLLAERWRILKEAFGLQEDEEIHYQKASPILKYNIAQEISRWNSISIVVSIMFEQRSELVREYTRHSSLKHSKTKKKTARDFYCEGLRYVLQRLAEESAICKWNHVVVTCDHPELGGDEYEDRTILLGQQAHFKKYQKWYHRGVGLGPGCECASCGLKELGFEPSIHESDPSYHDMLQIADSIVGITSKWIHNINSDENKSVDYHWKKELRRFIKLFRHRNGWGPYGCYNDGLIVHPCYSIYQKIDRSLV